MDRHEAYEFIRLFKLAEQEGVKIVDHDANRVEVELPGRDGIPARFWGDDEDAAAIIERITKPKD